MSWPSKRTWPRVGLQEAGEDFYGGTFPRAIGAQVSKHLARLKTKCDFSNSRDGTIELCESNRFEHGHPLDEQADKLPPWLETISFDTVRTDKVSVGRGRVHRLHPGLGGARSEEHTSELQSRLHLVCRLLLEKKNTQRSNSHCAI